MESLCREVPLYVMWCVCGVFVVCVCLGGRLGCRGWGGVLAYEEFLGDLLGHQWLRKD